MQLPAVSLMGEMNNQRSEYGHSDHCNEGNMICITSLKGTPADNAPNIPKQSAKPVTTAKRSGLNQRAGNFKIETQATPIDAPIISLPNNFSIISLKPNEWFGSEH